MPILVNCPQCQAAYSCPDEHRGKKLRCTKCQHVFAVPADAAGAAPAAPPPRPSKEKSPTAVAPQRRPAIPPAEEMPAVETDAPPPRKRSALPWILALVGAGLFLCCGA